MNKTVYCSVHFFRFLGGIFEFFSKNPKPKNTKIVGENSKKFQMYSLVNSKYLFCHNNFVKVLKFKYFFFLY